MLNPTREKGIKPVHREVTEHIIALDNRYVRQPACYLPFAVIAISFVIVSASSSTHV